MEMDLRYKSRSDGNENFDFLNIIVDEYAAIAASDECKQVAPTWIKSLAREARKVNIRLIILTQGAEVKALGLEGEGSLRECFTYIRLGRFAKQVRGLSPDLQSWLNQQKYPLLVEDMPAVKPPEPRFKTEVQEVQNTQNLNSAEPAEPLVNTEVQTVEGEFINPQNALERVAIARSRGATKEQILGLIWGATKGGTERWKMACKWYEENIGG
jgi:hypothetical protein